MNEKEMHGLELDTPKENDIMIANSDKGVQMVFMYVKEELMKKFISRGEWFSLKEFPTGVELHRFLEKHYDKERDWFLTNYIPTFFGAMDRVSKSVYNKIYSDLYSQKAADTAGYDLLFFCLFLAKELNNKRLPEIYSDIQK